MKKLLPILLVLLGLGGGVGAGFMLRPPPGEPEACAPAVDCPEPVEERPEPTASDKPTSFASLKKQFVIPVLRDGQVVALVVASLALEVDEGTDELAFIREPKLRDAFLQVMFIHAHSGGFNGNFTQDAALRDLKLRLYEVALPIMGEALHGVLITEIVRQDLS